MAHDNLPSLRRELMEWAERKRQEPGVDPADIARALAEVAAFCAGCAFAGDPPENIMQWLSDWLDFDAIKRGQKAGGNEGRAKAAHLRRGELRVVKDDDERG